MSDRLEDLGRTVAREQDQKLGEESLEDTRRQVLASLLSQPPRSRARRLWPLAAAAAILLSGAFVVWTRAHQLEATIDGRALDRGEWIAAEHDVPIELSDGSRFVLSPGTRGRLGDLNQDGAHLVVEAGSVEAAVVHRSRTKYKLSFGPFAVDVTGTRFDVNWDPAQELLTLKLREGSVLVSGCVLGSGRPLLAGETLRAWCREQRFEVQAVGRAAAPVAAPSAALAEVPPAASHKGPELRAAQPPAASASAEGPSWQALAKSGDYSGAFAAIGAAQFSGECERAKESDLWLLADVARLSKNGHSAIGAYSALRRRFPGGPKSGQAAFNIARLHFDQLGQYDEAARWFRTYLSEQPTGALAREALGRLMEAEHRAGHREAAASTARDYLKRHPSGPHARLATKLSATP
ncbi:MAG TPA: tetratricopeptide repeat protein [Polyangiaceae bacterium]|nr:tetratricopeptide repeat protein [Polyangiaceae bacterium]